MLDVMVRPSWKWAWAGIAAATSKGFDVVPVRLSMKVPKAGLSLCLLIIPLLSTLTGFCGQTDEPDCAPHPFDVMAMRALYGNLD